MGNFKNHSAGNLKDTIKAFNKALDPMLKEIDINMKNAIKQGEKELKGADKEKLEKLLKSNDLERELADIQERLDNLTNFAK